jgi:hypothetical protein
MQTDIRTVDAAETLETVLPQFAQSQASTVLVTEAGRLIGLLTADSVGAFLKVHNAMKIGARRGHATAA